MTIVLVQSSSSIINIDLSTCFLLLAAMNLYQEQSMEHSSTHFRFCAFMLQIQFALFSDVIVAISNITSSLLHVPHPSGNYNISKDKIYVKFFQVLFILFFNQN